MAKNSHIDVFIGSTSEDLKEYREAARDIILSFEFFPHMMEYWAAMDKGAVDLCMEKVDKAEVYIGIFAYRYGYIPDGSDISITEMEFNRATEKGIPRLCFLVDEDAPWPPKHIEDEPGKSKLKAFKSRIDSSLIRATFSNPDKLEAEVAKSLLKLGLHKRNSLRIGKYKAEYITKPTKTKNIDEAKVQIFIDGQVASFDSSTFLSALSGMLGVSANEIRIAQIVKGSILVQIELYTEKADKLYELALMYQRRYTILFSNLLLLLMLLIIALIYYFFS